jgi:tRNA nucleotidyltransferase/poly(A) polymerase
MKATITHPVVTEGHKHGTTYQKFNHPSYAQIQVSRINGHKVLYDSDFNSHNFIALRIKRSEMVRDLSRDWHHEKDELIEVCMSEAQWATLVSSLNSLAVPCTLSYLMGKQIDALPEPISCTNQFSDELSSKMSLVREQLNEAQALISTLGLSKTKAESLSKLLHQVKNNIGCNAAFVEKSFNEHMETQLEKAKCEANAYMYHLVQRAGLQALAKEVQALEDSNNPNESSKD